VPPKISKTQREEIVKHLGEGLTREVIAKAVGVTAAQVSAVAAHITMGTYEDANIDQRAETSEPRLARQQPRIVGESRFAIPVGTGKTSNDILYWSPTPDSGTPNPHLLVVGESGSGKTYATQCICAELALRSIPTIVFDFGQGFALSATPNEFREFARPVEINVGRDGININPLQIFASDIHGPVNVAQRIADTFARVYPTIGIQQHAVLRDAILETFGNVGIDPKQQTSWTNTPPRFGDLKLTLDAVARRHSLRAPAATRGELNGLDCVLIIPRSNVRFAPKATEFLRLNNLTLCAKRRHRHGFVARRLMSRRGTFSFVPAARGSIRQRAPTDRLRYRRPSSGRSVHGNSLAASLRSAPNTSMYGSAP
jgi:hypothetical protein